MQTCAELLLKISKIVDLRGDEGAMRMEKGSLSVPKSGFETSLRALRVLRVCMYYQTRFLHPTMENRIS